MQFCKTHWERLRKEVTDKGMFHLVSKSGEQAAERMKKQLDGKAVVPDPLMEAHNMLLERSIQQMGIAIMGDCCPLCEADKNLSPHPVTKLICSESWIVTLIEHLYDEYKKEGWLTSN